MFFFKQKTAYEMRISDWSSDVCSSDLLFPGEVLHGLELDLFVEKNARPRALYPSDSTLQFAEIGNGKPHFHAQLQRGFGLRHHSAGRQIANDRGIFDVVRNQARDRKSTRLNSSH